MLKTLKIAAIAALTHLLWAGAAQAAFVFTYNVDAYDDSPSDEGLEISTTDVYDYGTPLILSEGDSVTRALFQISTPESTLNLLEDLVPKPIEVLFSFTMPAVFNASSDGVTRGTIRSFNQQGVVEWGLPSIVPFDGGGILKITLGNEAFNKGNFFRLGDVGATVEATFNLIKAPIVPVTAPVPEPTTMLVWGSLFAVGAVVACRCRTSLRAA